MILTENQIKPSAIQLYDLIIERVVTVLFCFDFRVCGFACFKDFSTCGFAVVLIHDSISMISDCVGLFCCFDFVIFKWIGSSH